MAQIQSVLLRSRMNDVVVDIMPQTSLNQVVDGSGTTLSQLLDNITARIATKVAAESGKGLSQEDFTPDLKTKLNDLLTESEYAELRSGLSTALSEGLSGIDTKFTNKLDGGAETVGTVAYKIAQAIGDIDLSDITTIKEEIGDMTLISNITSIVDTQPTLANAIHIAHSIAVGRTRTASYTDYEDLIDSIMDESNTPDFKIGDNIYIKKLGVPDLWVAAIAENAQVISYTSDEDFIAAIKATGSIKVGNYLLSMLETEKVDLSGIELGIANNRTAIDNINNPTTGVAATSKSYTDTSVASAINEAKSYTDGFTPFYVSTTEPEDWSKVGVWAQVVAPETGE